VIVIASCSTQLTKLYEPVELKVGMHQSYNYVNVQTKSCEHLLDVYTNMAANNRKEIVFSYNSSSIASNSQQPH